MTFVGSTIWEDFLEHVACHLERNQKDPDIIDPAYWRIGAELEDYLLREGLIIRENGAWRIGDGRPR
jgi:hypothetical protein